MFTCLPDDLVLCVFWWLPCSDIHPLAQTCRSYLNICQQWIHKSFYYKTSMTVSFSRFRYAIKQYGTNELSSRFKVLLHTACFHANMLIIHYLQNICIHSWAYLCRPELFHFSNTHYTTRLPSIYNIYRNNQEIPQPLSENEINMFAEIKDPLKCTPLHIGVIMGHTNVCAFLLHHCSRIMDFVNLSTSDGDTALHLAVKYNHVKIVKLLLHNKAVLNKENELYMQPIHFASSRNILDLLLKGGAAVTDANKNGEQLVHFAAERSCVDIMRILRLEHPEVTFLEKTNQSCLQPIHYASFSKTDSTLKILSHYGVSLENASSDLWRPIHFACHSGNLQAVNYLNSRKCDMLARNRDGWTGLTFAVAHSDLQVIKLYEEYGLISKLQQPINARYGDVEFRGLGLMHLACLACAKKVVSFLHQKCRFSICCKDENGNEPIHCASAAGTLEVLKYLSDAGTNVCVTNDEGFTPLHYAQLILTACMDGRLSLHLAEQKKYHDIIRYLLHETLEAL